jgi:hypothetical protein
MKLKLIANVLFDWSKFGDIFIQNWNIALGLSGKGCIFISKAPTVL